MTMFRNARNWKLNKEKKHEISMGPEPVKKRGKPKLNGQFYGIAREPQWRRYRKGDLKRIEMNTKLVALIAKHPGLPVECGHSFGFFPTKPDAVIVQKWGRVCGYCRVRRLYNKLEKNKAWVARRAFLREVLNEPKGEWL